MRLTHRLLLILLVLFFSSSIRGQAPSLLNYQGLLNQNGNPANGTFNIQFAIWDSPSGGSMLYSETQSVTVTDGVFDVLIGSVNPLPEDLFTGNGQRYLGVKVGNDAEMTPRFRLVSVAYALSAAHAAVADIALSGAGDGNSLDAADGDPVDAVFVDDDGNVGIGTTTPSAHLEVQTNASKTGVFSRTTGTGNAGHFEVANSANTRAALSGVSNGQDTAIFGLSTGNGNQSSAGLFQILNATNPAPALEATTNGLGNAGLFNISNTESQIAALAGLTNGKATAIFGRNTGSDFNSTAGFFEIDNTNSSAAAVVGTTNGLTGAAGQFETTNTSGQTISVLAIHSGVGEAGRFVINNANNQFAAVDGVTNGLGNAAFFQVTNTNNTVSTVFAKHDNPNGSAAFFDGNITVTKNIFKGGGGFRIDHPLDPANKYLNHSFVESPDMMNIYNGNVVLDANGEAVVELPTWFEALNRDFRYQLTAIGAPGPNLYVAEEISNNSFRIGGGQPGMKVSWQVTGIRKDAHANTYRIPVEQKKAPAEKGRYLEPELYGQPAERAVGQVHGPGLGRLPKAVRSLSSHQNSGRTLPEANE